jgi:hypothetical protein
MEIGTNRLVWESALTKGGPDKECKIEITCHFDDRGRTAGRAFRAKRVVETVKLNVLTAYNAKDRVDLLRRFPIVDAILMHSAQLSKQPNLVSEVRTLCPGKPTILASPFAEEFRPETTFLVDSHKPPALLKLPGEDLRN